LLLALGSLWLLLKFPLGYAHLADVLPQALQFAVAWVTDGIAQFILLWQVIIGPVSAGLTMWKYGSITAQESPYKQLGDAAYRSW